MMVLLDAICTMSPKPATAITSSDSGSQRERPTAMSPAPNVAAARGMPRPRATPGARGAGGRAPPGAPGPAATK